MKKETAIEWLLQQMDLETISKYDKQLLQAKAMEWEQLGETWDAALGAFDARGFNCVRAIVDFDDYYNETYEKNEKRNRN